APHEGEAAPEGQQGGGDDGGGDHADAAVRKGPAWAWPGRGGVDQGGGGGGGRVHEGPPGGPGAVERGRDLPIVLLRAGAVVVPERGPQVVQKVQGPGQGLGGLLFRQLHARPFRARHLLSCRGWGGSVLEVAARQQAGQGVNVAALPAELEALAL